MATTTNVSVIVNNINSALQAEGFVKIAEFVDSFMISALTGIPVLYWGCGGYGKTEMILRALECFEGSFGMLEADPETSASHIKGGAIARTTKKDNEEITEAYYKVSESVLKKDKFFFEEILDAQFQGLSILKVIITNKKLHVNGDEINSINKILVGATNHNPKTFGENLPDTEQNSYEAFLQRFLIVEHGWDSHTSADYALLDNPVDTKERGNYLPISLEDLDEMRQNVKRAKLKKELVEILQALAQGSAESGSIVSPRAYKWTQKLMSAAALLRGDTEVSTEDLRVLKYLAYWDTSVVSGLEKHIAEQQFLRECTDRLDSFSHRIAQGVYRLSHPEKGRLVNASILAKQARGLEREITNSGKYPDSLKKRLDGLKREINSLIEEAERERDAAIICPDSL